LSFFPFPPAGNVPRRTAFFFPSIPFPSFGRARASSRGGACRRRFHSPHPDKMMDVVLRSLIPLPFFFPHSWFFWRFSGGRSSCFFSPPFPLPGSRDLIPLLLALIGFSFLSRCFSVLGIPYRMVSFRGEFFFSCSPRTAMNGARQRCPSCPCCCLLRNLRRCDLAVALHEFLDFRYSLPAAPPLRGVFAPCSSRF